MSRQPDPQGMLARAQRGESARAREDACREWLRAPDRDRIRADLDWLAGSGHALLTALDEDFPALLNDAPGAPVALFVVGEVSALWQPQIAVVGSRNATAGGLDNANAFARALGASGFVITSGLADGIDAAAHAAAIAVGAGTIAVLGTGPDRVYPARQKALAAEIPRCGGALVSQFPPGTPPHESHFPRRNRVIAGLSLGTLVVEAGVRSGALLTARDASECGREVFAIPGSIHNPLARGCHQLIRQGAKLVETAEEVITELAPLAQQLGERLRERLDAAVRLAPVASGNPIQAGSTRVHDPDYQRLFAALGHDPVGIDTLADRSGLKVADVASMLLMLELEGEVAATGGATYVRRSRA